MKTVHAPLTEADTELRVLVADDDPNEQLLLSAALQDLDLRAHFEFVADGAQLVRLLSHHESEASLPDLVVLDLRMPTMDGHQTLREIAAHREWWHIPVLIWTSSADPAEVEQCWEEGAVWFERKPETFDGYVRMVNTIEERCRRAREVADHAVDWDALLAKLNESSSGPGGTS